MCINHEYIKHASVPPYSSCDCEKHAIWCTYGVNGAFKDLWYFYRLLSLNHFTEIIKIWASCDISVLKFRQAFCVVLFCFFAQPYYGIIFFDCTLHWQEFKETLKHQGFVRLTLFPLLSGRNFSDKKETPWPSCKPKQDLHDLIRDKGPS